MSRDSTPNLDAVTLRELTRDNLGAILQLRVRDEQERFVASNAVAIAEAQFDPTAWCRAIYAGRTPVGFASLQDFPAERMCYLWRFMIDRNHQGNGYGRRAMELIIEQVRARGAAGRLLLSYHEGDRSPAGFYRKLGFLPTGEVDNGEVYLSRDL